MREDIYPTRKSDEPRLQKREDPTVWSEWHADAPLSREQTESYRKNGFLFLPGLFQGQELHTLLAESSRLRSSGQGLEPESVIAEKDSGDIRSIFNLHRQSETMARLFSDRRLAEVARFLLGDDVYIHQSRLNYKPGFRGQPFYWHSDFETWHAEDGMPRMRALSMSLLLTDNKGFNGPLMVMPGSHETFVQTVGETPDDNYKSSLREQKTGIPDNDSLTKLYETHGIETPVGPAGSLLIFDCNTMHGSSANISPLPRSNAFVVFNAWSNRVQAPFAAAKARPEFIAARENAQPLKAELAPA